jgi:hypothetical protein
MVRLVFTGSQPKNRCLFFISGWWWMGGGVGSLSFRDKSSRCIFELPSFSVLFSFQFNCAPTKGNYLQLFSAWRILLISEARGVL